MITREQQELIADRVVDRLKTEYPQVFRNPAQPLTLRVAALMALEEAANLKLETKEVKVA